MSKTVKRYTLQQRRAQHQQYLERVARRNEKGIGNSDPLQIRQTMTPDSGNAAQLKYGRLAAQTLRSTGFARSRHLAGSPREAREIDTHSL